jgi:DNA-binding GntR family transcriptional regulator
MPQRQPAQPMPSDLSTGSLAVEAPRPAERRFVRPRTLPEQIADHLGMAIVRGEYRDGERVGEQEVAEAYGVSRGPVREAIRMLASRGIVRLEPRRGATAIAISLDMVADLFNVRAALFGLAGRCFTRSAGQAEFERLAERLARLRQIIATDASDPIEFAHAVGSVGAAFYNQCGNPTLVHLLHEQGQTSPWGFIWREGPLDYTTIERRAACVEHYTTSEAAARNGDEARAETHLRKIVLESRDAVLTSLAATRGGMVDPSKLLR